MRPSAQFVIKQLTDVRWFSNVGIPDVDGVVVVSSWWEAMQHASSIEWQLVKGQTYVERSIQILSAGPWRVAELDRSCEDITPTFESLLAGHCDRVDLDDDLRIKFAGTVRDDVWRFCRDILTEDIAPPGFFTELFKWYRLGHFPCGWEGDYPHGSIVVY